MKAIWKYPLQLLEVQDLELPWNAQLLTVQAQHEKPVLWVLVDPDEPRRERRTLFLATMEVPLHAKVYLVTFQLHGGDFVGHVFEKKR